MMLPLRCASFSNSGERRSAKSLRSNVTSKKVYHDI
jgi:hypothetical protein